jgi:hypothetical protein
MNSLSELPDPKSLYTDFYNKMTELTANIVCASCGCLEYRKDRFNDIPIDHPMLHHLHVDPSLVPFGFATGFPQLGSLNLTIDSLGIVTSSPPDTSPALSICSTCKLSLDRDIPAKRSSIKLLLAPLRSSCPKQSLVVPVK